jgi:hypothetical protein
MKDLTWGTLRRGGQGTRSWLQNILRKLIRYDSWHFGQDWI